VDISTRPKPVIPICEHLFTAGRRCGSPAMRGTHFCYYHRQNRRPRGPEVIPDLTNHRNIQRALSNTLRGIASGTLTYEEGGRILHGISIAMHSLKISAPRRSSAPHRPASGSGNARTQPTSRPDRNASHVPQ
jgi:hypothetical protein